MMCVQGCHVPAFFLRVDLYFPLVSFSFYLKQLIQHRVFKKQICWRSILSGFVHLKSLSSYFYNFCWCCQVQDSWLAVSSPLSTFMMTLCSLQVHVCPDEDLSSSLCSSGQNVLLFRLCPITAPEQYGYSVPGCHSLLLFCLEFLALLGFLCYCFCRDGNMYSLHFFQYLFLFPHVLRT